MARSLGPQPCPPLAQKGPQNVPSPCPEAGRSSTVSWPTWGRPVLCVLCGRPLAVHEDHTHLTGFPHLLSSRVPPQLPGTDLLCSTSMAASWLRGPSAHLLPSQNQSCFRSSTTLPWAPPHSPSPRCSQSSKPLFSCPALPLSSPPHAPTFHLVCPDHLGEAQFSFPTHRKAGVCSALKVYLGPHPEWKLLSGPSAPPSHCSGHTGLQLLSSLLAYNLRTGCSLCLPVHDLPPHPYLVISVRQPWHSCGSLAAPAGEHAHSPSPSLSTERVTSGLLRLYLPLTLSLGTEPISVSADGCNPSQSQTGCRQQTWAVCPATLQTPGQQPYPPSLI